MQSFAEAFGLVLDEEVIEEIDEEETFYLWTSNQTTFNIYKTARFYSDEKYKLDSQVIIEMAKESSANVSKILSDIIYIHSGYVNVILDNQKEEEIESQD